MATSRSSRSTAAASPLAAASSQAQPASHPDEPPPRAVIVVAALVLGLVLAAQIPLAIGLLDADPAYEAGRAQVTLVANTVLALATVAGAAFLSPRRRALALVPGGLLAAATLAGAVTAGGHLWDLGAAALVLAGAWWVGRMLLRGLKARLLQGVVAAELTIGLGVAGLVTYALGRLDAIAWWSVGLLVLATGATGAWTAARAARVHRASAWDAVAGSRIGVACAGLLLLQLGWAVVWLSAPEIMYDALFSKAYLPALWAHTGSIEPLLAHPQLNVMGLAQLVAVPGHVLGAPDVGRWLQLLGWATLAGTVWWWGRRSVAGPLAALAVGVAPQLVWQSTTAYDDVLLALAAVALALAVLSTLARRDEGDASFGEALAIGLVAGACIWLKLHLAVVTVVLVGGWLLVRGPLRGLALRLAGVLLGGTAIAGPALAARWIDTGNPVFPTYNTIFKSTRYPLIDEPYNFPFWPDAGLGELAKLPYEAIVHPGRMSEVAPGGSFGLLVAAALLALLIGWRHPRQRTTIVVWVALAASLAAWWVQFRYLRYAVPAGAVAVVLVVAQLRGWRPGRTGTAVVLAAAAVASIAYLPATIANFWNVPHRDLPFAAAFGRWDADDYLRTVFPEKDALAAYQRLAPPGANALSEAHERLFLQDRALSPPWEVDRLLSTTGPSPTTGGEALRRVRARGIEWAVVPAAGTTGAAWLPPLLASHGQIAFADRGWALYRLVDRPARPRIVARPGGGATTHTVPVCPGETVAVELTTGPGGAPAQVRIDADSGDAKAGHTGGTVAPGTTGRVHGTAPPGTRAASVAIVPGEGGTVESARIGLLGRCSTSTR
jgi:hypothetical protein